METGMRIIDADELKALRELYIQGKLQFIENEYDLIDKCPTIDAEPVRHGRWIPTRPYMYSVKCSICGKVWDLETPRCPSCGAKMDLKE